ncbi:MAG: lysozyme inhibitor LprI family protein [Pseudomonadales bacterium]|jgi:hypothetical protein|nr:lysozyme inhibitor LprI family protein [Pseudomonadales bacterium]
MKHSNWSKILFVSSLVVTVSPVVAQSNATSTGLGATVEAVTTEAEHTAADTQSAAAALDELAQKSGLPAVELDALLADCDANQQSLYFCAWRDQIAAEQVLRRALAEQAQSLPQCRDTVAAEIASWMQARDQSCASSALEQWGEGSMRATAQALCVTAATAQMTQQLAQMQDCGSR